MDVFLAFLLKLGESGEPSGWIVPLKLNYRGPYFEEATQRVAVIHT